MCVYTQGEQISFLKIDDSLNSFNSDYIVIYLNVIFNIYFNIRN